MDKIPYMNTPEAKQDYAKLLSEKLGDSSRWYLFPATLTSGLIAQEPQSPAKFSEGIARVYILGSPKTVTSEEERGIGIVHTLKKDAPLYRALIDRGFSDRLGGFLPGILKQLDNTDELVAELKSLDSLLL